MQLLSWAMKVCCSPTCFLPLSSGRLSLLIGNNSINLINNSNGNPGQSPDVILLQTGTLIDCNYNDENKRVPPEKSELSGSRTTPAWINIGIIPDKYLAIWITKLVIEKFDILPVAMKMPHRKGTENYIQNDKLTRNSFVSRAGADKM